MTATTTDLTRELDHRESDGIEVRLLWRPHDGTALVAVSDARTGEAFTLEVGEGQRALDVFHHPYAYRGDARSSGAASLSEVTS
jgi:hypothetical protein